jgi:hypothetical protein
VPDDFYVDVDAKRNYLFVSASFSILVFDITNPVDPQLVQFVPVPSPPEMMEVKGNYLYVATRCALMIFEFNLPPVDCGDANADGTVNVSDAVYIINYIFVSGNPPDPYKAADVNCDTVVNVSDAVWIINYIFVGGNPPCDTSGNGQPDC